jgi:membrane-bound lytic murein transglycosylase D
MTATGSGQTRRTAPKATRAVIARVVRGEGTPREARLSGTFTVGADAGCDIRLADAGVAPRHFQIIFDGILWWARDLGSEGGTYVNGARIQLIPLPQQARVELGEGGPLLSVDAAEAERSPEPAAAEAGEDADPRPAPATERGASVGDAAAGAPRFSSETQIIERYLRPSGDAPAGRETMMFRRAFARAQRTSSRRYQIVVGSVALALLAAGSVIAYQTHKLRALRKTAEGLFYATKALEVQTAKVEELVLRHADPKELSELEERRARLRTMEKEYDAFVREMGIYAKMPEDERVILRVARTFGECDVAVPKGFVAEVRRYVQRWRSTGRLARALQRAKAHRYAGRIARVFAENGLPPQYVYLAAQESGFDERAVGPPTRFGYAKGMWQFLATTARRYGLRVGPLYDQATYDARDERFDWEKAAAAAAHYRRDLQATDAQGSGLLAMACYNWGEDKVRGIITSLPANPQERNFWRLLSDRKVPRETYDYVLSIFSAAVICENPGLFGLDVECPALGDGTAAGR